MAASLTHHDTNYLVLKAELTTKHSVFSLLKHFSCMNVGCNYLFQFSGDTRIISIISLSVGIQFRLDH